MDKELEKYLEQIDKNLKPLPTSERVDIIKEIKSTMLEMKQEKKTNVEILEKLGSPKDLAKAYLSDLLTKDHNFTKNNLLTVIAFYSLTGITGLFVIPILGIIAPVFMLCGILCPILGIIKLLGYLLHFEVPYLIFQLGSITLHPILACLSAIIIGILLYVLGKAAWKLLLIYLKSVSTKKQKLAI